MARHFGVSARTVYRWVEALSMADVPVYAEKGKGGGIRISENYAIDKAVLTEREKLDVLAGIRTLSTISLENASGSGGKNDGTEKKQHSVSNHKNSVTVPHKRRKMRNAYCPAAETYLPRTGVVLVRYVQSE